MQKKILLERVRLESDIRKFLGEKILNNCPQVAVETNISPELFYEKYVLQNKPVVIKGLLDGWSAYSKWDFDYFANNFADANVVMDLYDIKKTEKSSLKEGIRQIKSASTDKPVYLQEWWFQYDCPAILEDFTIPPHFENDENLRLFGYVNSTLWLGSKGACTPIHDDSVYSNIWVSQIKGCKEWMLFDKNACLFAKDDGEPDYEEFLRNPDNNVMHYRVQKGDTLYVPHKWWHRAYTLEDAISLNSFYISDEIVRRYIKDVLSIPMAVSLNSELLQEHDLRRYNICMTRIKMLCRFMKMDEENILGINTSSSTKEKGRKVA
ncbi:MAG: cupin-like domain-containing protein [Rickettsiales bacterium]|nr:cupin-like domain-containing protein [Pseudomonadota bacterium]MDA0965561.1 cupin-like domain-containing protein [Pseudomonadota bacterium]MDG4542885.1 cupin-like domain-containing protein [Rickettsiales bacterium]MDG4544667.1 cupin-like domain-containing protein [Rickettsiales bacterium]MDG4546789.1 cupin-like domain-containing protein [Rickettsiales bacterium]